MAPTTTPITIVMAVQTKLIMIEFLAPAQTASQTSLPRLSVPNMCSALGCRNLISGSFTCGAMSGEYPESIGCMSENRTRIIMTIETATVNLFFMNVRHTDFQYEYCGAAMCSDSCSSKAANSKRSLLSSVFTSSIKLFSSITIFLPFL